MVKNLRHTEQQGLTAPIGARGPAPHRDGGRQTTGDSSSDDVQIHNQPNTARSAADKESTGISGVLHGAALTQNERAATLQVT